MDRTKKAHMDKLRAALREHPDQDPRLPAVNLRGWRTEWDGPPFPVIVTRIDPKEKADA